jgi:hypothetical protein
MISGRLFVLKSKMNTTYLFWFNKSFNVLLLLWLLVLVVFLSLLRIKIQIKVGGLITTLIYLFNLWSLKLFYKHFQFEKTKHSQIMKLTAPQIDHLLLYPPALCRMVRCNQNSWIISRMLLKRKENQKLSFNGLKQGVQEVRRFGFMDVVEKRQTVLSKKYNSLFGNISIFLSS